MLAKCFASLCFATKFLAKVVVHGKWAFALLCVCIVSGAKSQRMYSCQTDSQYTGSLHVYMSFLKHQPCQPASLSSYGSFRVLRIVGAAHLTHFIVAGVAGCAEIRCHCEEDGTRRQPGSRGHHAHVLRGTLGTGRSVFSSGSASPFRRFWTQSSGTPLDVRYGREQYPTFVEVFSFSNGVSMSSTVSDLVEVFVFSLRKHCVRHG
jgi:hypothetical protein